MDKNSLKTAIESLQDSYEKIPYYFHTTETGHPDNIAVRAKIYGIDTASVRNCRVLDLGCGRGANLVAMAYQYRDSEFLGIDLSREHISEAQDFAKSLGLTNIMFRQQDILEISTLPGKFDFILVQGIFTWVPLAVQNKILSLCGQYLNLNGLASIAYATQPGYQVDLAIRNMMRFHIENLAAPEDRLEQAKNLLALLSKKLDGVDHWYSQMIHYLQQSVQEGASNFYHEFLNVETAPLHFSDFVNLSKSHGLKYVTESAPEQPVAQELLKRFSKELNNTPDRIRREQYKDFFINRRVRESILCHEKTKISFPGPEKILSFNFSSNIDAVKNGPDGNEEANKSETKFHIKDWGSTGVTEPVVKNALRVLSTSWPKSVSFEELLHSSSNLEIDSSEKDSENTKWKLSNSLLQLFEKGFVKIHDQPIKCNTEVADKPFTTPLIRYFSKNSDFGYVANQRNEMVWVDKFGRILLSYLDGNNNRKDLAIEITKQVKVGELTITDLGKKIMDPVILESYIQVAIDKSLRRLSKSAFLSYRTD